MQLFILVFGLITYKQLTVREYPEIIEAMVSVSTQYPGANSEIVEREITQVLEEQLATIQGLSELFSTSRFGESQINLTFKTQYPMEVAVNDVRDQISAIVKRLPIDSEVPVVAKASADSQPIIWLALTSEHYDLMALTEILNQTIEDDLSLIDGVAKIRLVGDRERSMRIEINPLLLNSYGLTVQQVVDRLRSENVSMATGTLFNQWRQYTLTTEAQLTDKQAFESMIVSAVGNEIVRLSDIAKVIIAPKSDDSITRFNGKPAIAVGLIKQSDTNPLSMAEALYQVLPRLESKLPPDVQLQIAYDSTRSIAESIQAVNKTLLEAIGFVLFVVVIFLGQFRAALIPLLTIPISLLGACFLMWVMNFSINLLTLLAMVLAIGLVVDDAIVVVENYFRHKEKGEDSFTAISNSMAEISGALVAMTLTLAAVYLPLQFIQGALGRLLSEFAVVLAGAVIISGFVALTLTPLLCHLWLKNTTETHDWRITRLLESLYAWYQKTLPGLLNNTKRNLLLLGGVIACLGLLLVFIPSELIPDEDRNFAIAFSSAPPGATVNYTDHYAQQVESIIAEQPDVTRYFSVTGFGGVTENLVFIGLKDKGDRKESVQDILTQLQPKFSAIPGLMTFAFAPPSSLGGSSGRSFRGALQVNLLTTESYAELDRLANAIIQAAMAKQPKIINVQSSLKMNKPEYRIQINRDKVAQSGLTVAQIAQTMQWFFSEMIVDYYPYQSEQHAVILQLPNKYDQTLKDILNLPIATPNMGMTLLANFVTIEPTLVPTALTHMNKYRSTTISGDLGDNLTLGEALEVFEEAIQEVGEGKVFAGYSGFAELYKQTSKTFVMVFFLSLIVIYLILCMQFESFFLPLVIMCTVPLALFGAFFLIWISGSSLNLYTQVGIITLIGLITKHGILLMTLVQKGIDQGLSVRDAVWESATHRIRPILMTTAAMLLGALPLVIATGLGAESRQQIGIAISGGMLFGTMFTLLLLPTIILMSYHLRDKLTARIRQLGWKA